MVGKNWFRSRGHLTPESRLRKDETLRREGAKLVWEDTKIPQIVLFSRVTPRPLHGRLSATMKTFLMTCLFALTVGLLAGCSKSSDTGSQQPPAQPPGPPPAATHTN
jgi:hypothetical protein